MPAKPPLNCGFASQAHSEPSIRSLFAFYSRGVPWTPDPFELRFRVAG